MTQSPKQTQGPKWGAVGARKAAPKPPKRKPAVRGGDDGAETQKAYTAAEKRARADAKKYGGVKYPDQMYGTNARELEMRQAMKRKKK